MATDELTMCGLEASLGTVAAKPIVRGVEQQRDGVAAIPAVGAAGRVLARLAVTVVLAVCGSALALAILGILDAAPLAVFAAVIVASWIAAGRVLEDAGAGPHPATSPPR